MDPPGTSAHGILHARILEQVAIYYFRGSSQPRDWNWVCFICFIGRWFLYQCDILEVLWIPTENSNKIIAKMWQCQKHLTGGFLCAVLDLSGILWSLLIPKYSGIKRRGMPFPGLRNPGISFLSFSIQWKVIIYNPLFIWIASQPYGLNCSLLSQ